MDIVPIQIKCHDDHDIREDAYGRLERLSDGHGHLGSLIL
jgi:hypothetical protein